MALRECDDRKHLADCLTACLTGRRTLTCKCASLTCCLCVLALCFATDASRYKDAFKADVSQAFKRASRARTVAMDEASGALQRLSDELQTSAAELRYCVVWVSLSVCC